MSYIELSSDLINVYDFILLSEIFTIIGYFSRFARMKYPSRSIKSILIDLLYYLFTVSIIFISCPIIPIISFYIPSTLLKYIYMILVVVHLLSYDYIQHNSNISTCSIILISIIISGKMKKILNIFSFVNMCFILFVLVPDMRRELRNDKKRYIFLTIEMIILTSYLIRILVSVEYVKVFLLIIMIIWFIFPLFYISIQKYKRYFCYYYYYIEWWEVIGIMLKFHWKILIIIKYHLNKCLFNNYL